MAPTEAWSSTSKGSGRRRRLARRAGARGGHPDAQPEFDQCACEAIILGGDILEGDDASERDLASSLNRLSAPLGVWAVTGNHELHAEARNGNNNLLESVGLNVLHDQCAMLEPGLALAGVDDLISRRRTVDTSPFVNQALGACRSAGAIVFASHAPSNVETAARAGAQVMLSGHTHNGQIWPFGYFVRFLNPYYSGAYEVDGMHLFVSRGAGTWGPRMRLWRRGEILRITLRAPTVRPAR